MTIYQIAVTDLLLLFMGFGAGVVFSVSVLFADILILREKAKRNNKAFDKVIKRGQRTAELLEAEYRNLTSSTKK